MAAVDLTVRERVVESYFQRVAREEYGCVAEHLLGPPGWPDQTLLWPTGTTDFVELKRPKGGRFEPMQLRTHDKLRDMGFVVIVLNNRVEVRDYLAGRANVLGVTQRKRRKTLMEAVEFNRSMK